MLFAACLPSCSNEKSPLTRAEFVEESKLNFLAVFFLDVPVPVHWIHA